MSNVKTQRITIKIDGVEHKGIVKSEKTPVGLDTEVKGLVDAEGNKHENLSWIIQNLRPGKWLNYEITALEDISDEIPA